MTKEEAGKQETPAEEKNEQKSSEKETVKKMSGKKEAIMKCLKNNKWRYISAVLLIVLVVVMLFGVQIDIRSRRLDWSTAEWIAGDDAKVVANPTAPAAPAEPTLDDFILGEADVSVDDDFFVGKEDAPITMIEFSDFECPYCARHVLTTFDQIKKDYVDTGKVRVVFRDFPLDTLHPHAPKDAEAAECAQDQGKYLEYHQALFENQQKLGTEDALYDIAKEVGLNEATFKTCFENETHKEEVEKDAQDALDAGLQGTPAFIVNNTAIAGAMPYEMFAELFEQILAEEK